MKAFAWTVWPVGLVLTFAYVEADLIPLPVFIVLDLAYLAAVAVVVRRAGTPAGLMIAPAGLIFSLAALTGAPTATRPGAMVANAAVLGAAGAVLLVGAIVLATRLWDGPGRAAAAVGVAALAVGTTCYLANLLARFAVMLSGAAPAQAAVEDRAWQAHAYLQGLDGEPSPLALLLVWLDLLQVAYVVLTYLAAAALAVASRRAGWLADRPARILTGLGTGLAAAVVAGGVLGSASPEVGPAGAGVAFALTIPFMSTLLAAMLGAALHPAVRSATAAAAHHATHATSGSRP